MSRNTIPPRPTGDDAEAYFMQRVWDICFGTESRYIDSTTVRVEETTRGIAFHAAPARAGGSGTVTHLGEWSAATTYKAQQIVTRGALGEFIAFQNPPVGTAPETGAPYWHAWVQPFPGVWG